MVKKEKFLIYFGIVLILVFVLAGLIYFFKFHFEKLKPPLGQPVKKEITTEETVQRLTAPEKKEGIPPVLLKNLTAPKKIFETSQEILKNLTAPIK